MVCQRNFAKLNPLNIMQVSCPVSKLDLHPTLEILGMPNVKEKMTEVIQSHSNDASYEEIIRKLAFDLMIERGLQDSRSGRVISDEDMRQQILSWRESQSPTPC